MSDDPTAELPDDPAHEAAPASPKPRVPSLPKGGRRQERGARRQQKRLWVAALVVGLVAGAIGYRLVKPIRSYFDYWVTRAIM